MSAIKRVQEAVQLVGKCSAAHVLIDENGSVRIEGVWAGTELTFRCWLVGDYRVEAQWLASSPCPDASDVMKAAAVLGALKFTLESRGFEWAP